MFTYLNYLMSNLSKIQVPILSALPLVVTSIEMILMVSGVGYLRYKYGLYML